MTAVQTEVSARNPRCQASNMLTLPHDLAAANHCSTVFHLERETAGLPTTSSNLIINSARYEYNETIVDISHSF
jgi:hypothetical protein